MWGPPGTEQNAPSSSPGQFLSEAGETGGHTGLCLHALQRVVKVLLWENQLWKHT